MKKILLSVFAVFLYFCSSAIGPITGVTSVCAGGAFTTTLYDTSAGGTWSSSDITVGTIDTSGVFTGILPGTTTISYSTGSGLATIVVTVYPGVTPISGISGSCTGITASFTDSDPGGTWTSSNTAIASIGLFTGIFSSLSVGLDTIIYTLPTGCFTTSAVNVYPNPSTITGVTTICVGSSTTLSDGTAGGTWSSSNTAVAAIITSLGLLTGISAGTSIITYTLSTGCYTTTTETILPSPGTMTGVFSICTGATTTLSDGVGGGIWSSSNTAIATIGSTSGVLTGVSTGTATVSYTMGGACSTRHIVSVGTVSAGSISGPSSVCSGSAITLTDGVSGGIWSAGNTNATVGSTGLVTGVTAGTCMISYTVTGSCGINSATKLITINSSTSVGAISGVSAICIGGAGTLTETISGGVWTSSNTGVATIGSVSGVVSGIATGTTLISYTVTGCSTGVATYTFSVNADPVISGGASVCPGGSLSLSAIPSGGVWTSLSTGIATVGSTSGIVTGIITGTTVISYYLGTGCSSSQVITVGSSTSAGTISGYSVVCVSLNVTLTDGVSGGTWSSSDPSIATAGISSGLITGVMAGTVNITYTVSGTCGSAYTTKEVTVTGSSSAGTISGPSDICTGIATSFGETISGGIWTSSNPSIATVGSSSGLVTGISAGSAIITYSVTSCSTVFTTKAININVSPASITGFTSTCIGFSDTLNDATTGGTWSSSNTALATIGSLSGILTSVGSGSVNITYSLPAGCFAVSTSAIGAMPTTITGTSTICVGSSATLSDAVAGGTWGSSNTAVAAIISSLGLMTGISAGTSVISYTLSTGCMVTTTVHINASPTAITGTFGVCTGESATLSDGMPGGLWTSSAPTIAIIGSSSGVFTGMSTGVADITYTIGGTCSVSHLVTITAGLPAITGIFSACPGGTFTLSDATSGGTWSSSNRSVAGIGSVSGVVSTVSAGVATITYQTGAGCIATQNITVNASPAITFSSSEACGGSLTLTAAGGSIYSWAPSTGLSCSTCASITIQPVATVVYTVTVTTGSGCTGTAIDTVDGNRIAGYISFSSALPDTLDTKVWLIQFDALDSSIAALDSTVTCLAGGTPYYEFKDKPAGNYMVKGSLIYGNTVGTSGYIPTYSLSTPHWDSAATITHSAALDTLHINMIAGIVPPGPGFISGYISSGAGRGTSDDVPAKGMLVFLEDTLGKALTYTYTDTNGRYKFGNLALGEYIVYPEAYKYRTIILGAVTLSGGNDSVSDVLFYQSTTSHTIRRVIAICCGPMEAFFNISPNPASGNITLSWESIPMGAAELKLTDVTGREVFSKSISINSSAGNSKIDLPTLQNGIYLLHARSGNINYTWKLLITQ